MTNFSNLRYGFICLAIIVVSAIAGFYSGSLWRADVQEVDNIYADASQVYTNHDGTELLSSSPVIQNVRSSVSGDYLVAITAQRRHDWRTASLYFQKLLEKDPDNLALQRRAMVLLLGSHQLEEAALIANQLVDQNVPDDMAHVILTLKAVKQNRFEDAFQILKSMADGNDSRVVKPLIHSWVQAGLDKLEVDALTSNPLYIYDAIKIATFLQKGDETEKIMQKALNQNGIIGYDLERIGDLFAQLDLKDKAKLLYQTALQQQDKDVYRLTLKITALDKDDGIQDDLFIAKPPESVIQGLSQSIFDISMVLFRQGADGPARLYASMALALKPDFTDARFLLAHIMAYEGQFDEALRQYIAVPQSSDSYQRAQRQAAQTLEQAGRINEAIDLLRALEKNFDDVKARIEIGNIQRRQENYAKALESYNKAFKSLDSNHKDKWHLHYMRGMALERLGRINEAKDDLMTALKHQPDIPHILYYLGYTLADHGMDLDKSLEMIQKAVSLQPNDGYIRDSLGWVLYRLGQVEQAVPHLEQAVELLPYDAIINDHLGDAYWQVGRHLEARFQWRRALNHTEDTELIATIKSKMKNGLTKDPEFKSAHQAIDKTPSEVE